MSVNKIINESFACFGKAQTMNKNRGVQSDPKHHEDDIKAVLFINSGKRLHGVF